MNKKAIVLAALLTVAGGLIVKNLLFPPLPGPPPSSGGAEAATTAPAPSGGAVPATPAANAKAPAAPAAPAGPVDVDELAKGVQVVDFYYEPASVARNPMTPLVGPQAVFAGGFEPAAFGFAGDEAEARMRVAQMAVTGIVWDSSFPLAVVDDDVVAPGDVLADGVVVESIEPDRVILQVGGSSVPLPLKTSEEQ